MGMTRDMFMAMLKRAGCKADGDQNGLEDGRSMTLYLSRDGASLQVGKVIALKEVDGIVEALNNKGELFMVHLDDLFAASVTGADDGSPARKAGFLGSR
jgi:hypothetical protein